jgi:hypothetical protein
MGQAKRKNKITTSEAIEQLLKMDIWTQRKFGREMGLDVLKQLQRDMPEHRDTLTLAAQQERLAIRACDSKDTEAWDRAVAESARLLGIIKAAR